MLDQAKEREEALLADVARPEDFGHDDTGPAGGGYVTPSLPAPTRSPPAPALVARTDTTITLRPRRWFAAPLRVKSAVPGDTTVTLVPAEVDHVKLYGKSAGAGTDVSLTNIG